MAPQDIPLTEDESNSKQEFLAPDIKKDKSGVKSQYLASGIVTLGAFAAGCAMSWSSSAVPLLSSSYKLLGPERLLHESWIASIVNVGALAGAIPAGLISENFGRKFTLLSLAVPMVVAWILIAVSPSLWGIYVGRFVIGVTVGAISVSIPPYIADIAEARVRTRVSNLYHIQMSAGIFYGYLISMVESLSIISLLAAIIPTAYFIAFLFMPESPVYLTTQGKHSEAKGSLQYFRGIDNNVDQEVEQIKEDIRESFRNKGTFKSIFNTKTTMKALIISFGLMTFQQLSGICAIIFYAARIFEICDSAIVPQVSAVLLGLTLFGSSLISHGLQKNVGTRTLLLVSHIMMAITIATIGVYIHLSASLDNTERLKYSLIPVLCVYLYVAFYAVGVGPIPWLILRQIFPKNITRRCTALAAAVNWFLAFGVTVMFQKMVAVIGNGWVMWNFGVICILGALFVYFFVPETKGKDLSDIQADLEGVRRRRRHRHIIEVESVSITMD